VSKTDGTLTVDQSYADGQGKRRVASFGVANPTFSGSYYGQKNGDTFTMSFSTTATTGSAVGDYDIVPSATGARSATTTGRRSTASSRSARGR
jgi:hypothetical protein